MFDINKILSLKSSWEILKETDKPIFIYGMGDGCLKLLNVLDEEKITVSGIFASDEFVRGHYFCGHLVHKLSEIELMAEEKNFDFIILLAFAAGYESLINKIDDISKRHTVIMPDTAVIGGEPFLKEHLIKREEDIKKVYEMLADEKSQENFINILKYKITGNLDYLRKTTTSVDEAYRILSLSDKESYADLGAYNGDTVLELLKYTNKKYNRIYALEPNKRNFKKLDANTKDIDNIEIYNAAAWSEDTTLVFSKGGGRQSQISKEGIETPARSLDSILNGREISYIKYDVEGAEEEALIGSCNAIKAYKPKLFVSVYHRLFDMIDIPLQIAKLNNDYKFYLRHFPYYPAWETNLICI